jgi:hypothetical protein
MQHPRWTWTLRKTWLAGLGLVGVGIVGCALAGIAAVPAGRGPAQVPPPALVVLPAAVPHGFWVQPGIAQMLVETDSVGLAFDCGNAMGGAGMRLDQALLLDAGGHFAAETTHLNLPRRNGGMMTPTSAPNETPIPLPYARLSGLTDGRTLVLNVAILDPQFPATAGGVPFTTSYGLYTLTLSQVAPPPLVQCTPQS